MSEFDLIVLILIFGAIFGVYRWMIGDGNKQVTDIETNKYSGPVHYQIEPATKRADAIEDRIVHIKSSSSDTEYLVNIGKRECTCMDFADTRARMVFGSPRRLCKHLVKAIYEDVVPNDLMKYKEDLKISYEDGTYFKYKKNRIDVDFDDKKFSLYLPGREDDQWAQVFRLDDDYGWVYSITDERWGRGLMPFGDEELATKIVRFINKQYNLREDVFCGPKGGVYHLSSSGKKVYHTKKDYF